MSHDIMIDLETLATTADAAILSIGAVRFDLEAGLVFDECGGGFYQAVHLDGQNRAISQDTLAWWMDQCKDAQRVFIDPNREILEWALDNLTAWIDTQPGTARAVWSNGADFDLPMLNHAYKQYNMASPWKPYAGRCYRTYKTLPGARSVKVEREGQHHNALDDAIYQAKHLCAIHQALFSREEGSMA